MSAPRGGPWARGLGVWLRRSPRPLEERLDDGLARALRDGVERGYRGPLPESPPGAEWFAVRAGHETVGLLAFRRDLPRPGEATVLAVAITPQRRGHGYGARALFVAERRLRRDGVRECYARVPRSNGRGLYFVLRAGYAPAPPPLDDGATWFRRSDAPAASGPLRQR